jgi:hypothetical protein
MKKIAAIILVMTAFLGLKAEAQYSEPGTSLMAYIGVGTGYNVETEAASIRFNGGFPTGYQFFSYFVDGGLHLRTGPKAADVNANLRFFIPGSDAFMPYVYTGFNYTRYGRNNFGVNLGLGTQLAFGPGFFFVRGQYTVGDLDMISVNAGISYVFRTMVR